MRRNWKLEDGLHIRIHQQIRFCPMNDPILEQLETGLSHALAQLRENERWSATTALETVLTFIDAVPG